MNTSESIKAIAPALLAAQKAIGAVVKDADNPFFNSKYADLTSVIAAVKPALNDNGIVFIQSIGHDEIGPVLTTRLLHETGEWIEDTAPVVCKKQDDPQALGSGLTYMERYGLKAMTGLPTAEDDDGNAATKGPTKPKPKAAAQTPPASVKDKASLVQAVTKWRGDDETDLSHMDFTTKVVKQLFPDDKRGAKALTVANLKTIEEAILAGKFDKATGDRIPKAA